jgi:hypothetical protein
MEYYCLPAAMHEGTFKVNLAESDLNIAHWESPSLRAFSGVSAASFNMLNMINIRETMSI